MRPVLQAAVTGAPRARKTESWCRAQGTRVPSLSREGTRFSPFPFSAPALFLLARVVARIHVDELHWRHSVDLDHSVSAGHGVMVHAGIEIGEGTLREAHHLAHVEGVSHADLQSPRDYSDVFALGMPMRRNAIAIRHLQPNRVISARGHGVAF